MAKVTKHRDALIQYALSFPGAFADHPWGEVVAKIGKKVFVFFGHPPEDAFGMSVKLPQSGGKVLMAPFAEPTGYGLGKSGWVSVRFTATDVIPPTETLCAWIEESFRAVANKTQVKALDAAPPKVPKGPAAKKATAKKSAAKKATAKKSAAKKATAKKSAPRRRGALRK
ncbi:MAG: MmcQ/YjbR family DNA-binding protein [Deltaproteobacteria bacterium]